MKAYSTYRIFTILMLCYWTNLFTSPVKAQCIAPTMKFHSPVLISGTDRQVGAVYNFANVLPGVDAHIGIEGLFGGATLYNIDDTAGTGYYDAFQPYVGAAPNDTSYIDWKISFKKAGTSADTILPCVAVTGVDVDGDGVYLKEFIEAATPGSFAVDPVTNLTVSFDGVRSKAISPVTNVPLIDTNRLQAMFQMNFVNVSNLQYRNGAISTYGSQQIRQTCIYFKPFFSNYFLLPSKLLSFTANLIGETVKLNWTAADEGNIKHYTLQRSENGKSWMNIGNFPVISPNKLNSYIVNDFTEIDMTTYYRVMEVSLNGSIAYSSIVKIEPGKSGQPVFRHNTVLNNNIVRLYTDRKSVV